MMVDVEAVKTNNGWMRKMRLWVMPAVGLVLLLVLLSQLSWASLNKVITEINPTYLFLAWITSLLATVIRALRFSTFFHPGRQWLKLFGTFGLARLVIMTMPFRSGELVTLAMLKKNGLSPSIAESTPVWLLLRISDLTALALFFAVVVGLSAVGEQYVFVRWLALLGCLALLLGTWVAARVAFNSADSLSQHWWAQRLSAMRKGFARIRDIKTYLCVIWFALCLWLAMIATVTSVQLAFNSPLDVAQCVLVAVLVLVASMIPINAPMDLGTGDAVWVAIMVLLGVELKQAIALAVVIRIVVIFMVLVDGALGMLLLTLARRLQSVEIKTPGAG